MYKSRGCRDRKLGIESYIKNKWRVGIGDLDSIFLDGSKIVHIVISIAINDKLSLLQFMNVFSCLLAPPRPNINNRFQLIDVSLSLLQNSSSFLKPATWVELFNRYPDSIQIHLLIIFYFGAQLGYKSPNAFIISKNLASALANTGIIDKKLVNDLKYRHIEKVPKITVKVD